MPLSPKHKSLTLIELLIAVILLSVIVLAFSNIQIFGHFQVLTGDRRAKVQNEAARVLAHMSKEISRAIGNEPLYGAGSVVKVVNNPNDRELNVYVEGTSPNGRREVTGSNPPESADHWIGYRFDTTGSPANLFELRYCGLCRDDNCNFNQCNNDVETLSNRITEFSANPTANTNLVETSVTAC